jgi:hypothetical protein
VTTPHIPGLELHIPAGTMIRDVDGQVVTSISITPIPVDRPPFPLPPAAEVPIYFTIQPGLATLSSKATPWPAGARLIYRPLVKPAWLRAMMGIRAPRTNQ